MENVNLKAILEKAAKIKALADRAGTPEEAANAAAKLQAMMLRYNLTEQAVEENLNDNEDKYVKEGFELNENRNHKGWAASLYYQIAKANQCESLFYPGTARMSIVGRKHNIEMVNYLYGYLSQKIKSLAENAARGSSSPGRYRRAFCLGAVSTVGKRLRDEVNNVVKEEASYGALMVVEKQLVEKEFKKHFPRTRKGGSSSIGNGDAYAEGRAAGRNISLRGGIGSSSKSVGLLG
jgi:hypothetical protein